MNNVGERIKQARLRKNMTQEELAKELDITKSAVSRYELGKREPSLALLYKIAYILDCELGDLFDGTRSRSFGSVDEFNAARKQLLEKQSNVPSYESVTVHVGNGIKIIDHRKEWLNKIYDQLDDVGQRQFVKYGEFLLKESEDE